MQLKTIYFDFSKLLFEFNFFFLCLCIFISLLFFYFFKIFNLINLFKNYSITPFIRDILLISLLISFFILICSFYLFIKFFVIRYNNFFFINNLFYFENLFYQNIVLKSYFNIDLSIDFFGYIFIILAYIIGFISFLVLDSKLYYKNIRFIFICNFLILVIYFFVIVNNLLLLFLSYECMLIPSFLFVYFVGSYRRSIQASLYFLIWTQIGSLFVLISISYIIYVVGNDSFIIITNYKFTYNEIYLLYLLLFVGFGFKVPITPFHYWLTKTHVEAPAGFSIFLSGFLVKTAIYGFYKITNKFGIEIDTQIFSMIVFLSIFDSSLKMWSQIDLKKLIAYCTIQEMNIIYLAFLWGDARVLFGGVLFCITHSFLSALMFYLVDCVQRRYNTRIISELSGILHITPNLGISIFFMNVIYSGLPGTIKFTSELFIFIGLYDSSILLLLLLVLSNFIGLLGFSKNWFNVLFGLSLKYQNSIPIDLVFKELFIIFICIFFSFFTNFLLNCMIDF